MYIHIYIYYIYIYIYYTHVGTCRKQLRMVFLGCKRVKLMPLPPMLNLEVYEWLLHGGTCDSLGQRVIQNSMASPRDCGIRHSRSQAPKGARQSDSHDTSVFTSSMQPCVSLIVAVDQNQTGSCERRPWNTVCSFNQRRGMHKSRAPLWMWIPSQKSQGECSGFPPWVMRVAKRKETHCKLIHQAERRKAPRREPHVRP